MPCASLVILATPPATLTRATGWARMYFSMPPTKSPMSISAISGRPCSFRIAASEVEPVAAGDVVEARRPRHVDAAEDRMDPGRAGIGDHHAGGAEDRDAAENAEAPVQRLQRHRLAVRHRDLDLDIGRIAGRLGDCFGNHPARHRIDRRLAGRDRQAGPRHRSDAGSGLEGDAGTGRAAPDRRPEQRAMRHVGIVAGILDHAGPCEAVAELPFGEREGDALAAGQPDLDRVGEFAGDQRRAGSLGRCGRAGSRRPAAPQRAVRFIHGKSYRRAGRPRHCQKCHRELRGGRYATAERCAMSLEESLARLSAQLPQFERGHVWLAGAGPGAAGCLTLDVVSALSQADAVVYDALIDSSILSAARDGAQMHFAGKRGGKANRRARTTSPRC